MGSFALCFVGVVLLFVAPANCWSCHSQESLDALQGNMEAVLANSRNIKHIAWKEDDEKEDGVIKNVTFNKKWTSSALKLTYSGNLRVRTTSGVGCKRWYFTIMNEECKDPQPIDGVIWHNIGLDQHQHTTITGICKVPVAGNLTISFNIGKCGSYGGDGRTGWNSASHMIIEELSNVQ